MAIAFAEYKCRRCGQIIQEGITSVEDADKWLKEYVTGGIPRPAIGMFTTTIIHFTCVRAACAREPNEERRIIGRGIADLIGFGIRSESP